MKVRDENADLINFYLKQGTNCQKPQGISLEKKHYSLSLQCFPIRKGRNFSMFILLFFSNISQCYKITHLNFCLDRLALSILRFFREDIGPGHMWAWSVYTSPGTEGWPLPAVKQKSWNGTFCKIYSIEELLLPRENRQTNKQNWKAWGKSKKVCHLSRTLSGDQGKRMRHQAPDMQSLSLH